MAVADLQALNKCTELFATWFGLDLVNYDRQDMIFTCQSDAAVQISTNTDVIIIRAPMGSGKTTALISWLKMFRVMHLSTLVISCRRTFAMELFNRFCREGLTDFELYLNIEDRIFDRPNLIIQIESLYRTRRKYEILILDEVMSIINQFYSSTMKQLDAVDTRFIECLQQCKYLIAMDATINRPLIEFIMQHRGSKTASLILNTYVADNFCTRRAIFLSCFDCPNHIGFLSLLYSTVSSGKNVCVFVSTVSAAELLFHELQQRYPGLAVLKLTGKDKTDTVDNWDK